MKNQKIAIATVITTFLIVGLDFLFYVVLMDNPGGGECCMKEMPDMVHMILGDLLCALAFVVIYDKTASKTSGLSRGIIYGIWFAVFASIGTGLVWYSLMEMEMNMLLMDAVYGVVKYGILGAVVCYFIGKTTGDGDCGDGSGDRGKASGGGEMEGNRSGEGERGKATGGGE